MPDSQTNTMRTIFGAEHIRLNTKAAYVRTVFVSVLGPACSKRKDALGCCEVKEMREAL